MFVARKQAYRRRHTHDTQNQEKNNGHSTTANTTRPTTDKSFQADELVVRIDTRSQKKRQDCQYGVTIHQEANVSLHYVTQQTMDVVMMQGAEKKNARSSHDFCDECP